MIKTALVLGLIVTLHTAETHAGDPCPIGYTLFDVGPPPWLAGSNKVASKDPLFEALLSHGKEQTCSDVRRGKVKEGALAIGGSADPKNKHLLVSSVYKGLFSKGRRFRCKRAARKLGAFAKLMPDAALIYIRGRKRTLLVVPGWTSLCIQNASYEGKKLKDKAIARLWKRVTGRFTKDRHDNP